jgi:hypothetical protein
MRSQRPRQSRTRPLNELTAALWPAFISLRKSQGPFKSRPNCPAVCPEGVQVVPGVLRGEDRVPRGTGRYRSRSAVTPAPPRGTTLIGQNPFEHRRYPLYRPPKDVIWCKDCGDERLSVR